MKKKMLDHLSTLPVELINKILDNVSPFDILTSVCLVNKRLRTVSLTYPRFRLDLTQSFKKMRQFDQLCNQLAYLSSQIVSLMLYNEDDPTIPAKITNFFSQPITINSTFSNLHSLSLSYVNRGVWDSIKARLTSLVRLTSISINFITTDKPSRSLCASVILAELLFFSSSLKHLFLSKCSYPPDIATIEPSRALTPSSIEYLSLHNIAIDFVSLFAVTPSLRYFTSTGDYSQVIKNIDQNLSVHLQRLSITFDGITFDKVEPLLSSMTYLTHFTLIADEVQRDMANGDRWAELLNTITTFQFKFTFRRDAFMQQPPNLYSFHTKFWLVEKKWYVTYDWCIDTHYSLLYSNPYCLEWYPFGNMVGRFVTESTGPESTSFLHVKYFDYYRPSLMNNIIWRRCTNVNHLSVTPQILNQNLSYQYVTTYLNLTIITSLTIDSIEIETSIDTTVQLMYSLPSLRSLCVSVTILKLLFAYNWSRIVHLNIIWGSDRLPKLLTQSQTDSFCRSFTHLEQLQFSRCFVNDISQLLNSMMMTLSHVFIEHSQHMTPDDDRFISYEWLQRNTKLRYFDYSCDNHNDHNTVHIWL